MNSERRIGEKGRVTLPKSVRERLNLEPGEYVEVSVEEGRVVLKPRISRDAFVETMEGCLTEETRATDAPRVDPLDLKADWTDDLPN